MRFWDECSDIRGWGIYRNVGIRVYLLYIAKYERIFGKLANISLEEGVRKTANFMREEKLWNV